MTTEANEDFAAFEARVMAGEPDPVEEQPEAEGNPEVNDTLELTDEDELVEEEGEEETGEKKHRSKSAKQRIDELTKARREAERRNQELEQRLAALESGKPQPQTELKAPDPNDYEFGEEDRNYIKDQIRFELKQEAAEKEATEQHAAAQQNAVEAVKSLDDNWAEAETRGAEKYGDDFAKAIETYQTELPEVPFAVNLAIQASPVAEDLAYHMGTNIDDAQLVVAMFEGGDPMGAARRLGEIEGQYLTERPQAPARNAHPLEHALHAGRLKAFVEKGSKAKAPEVKMTNAPEPARHSVRGTSGKFGVDDDTEDFAAFEKKIMAGKK